METPILLVAEDDMTDAILLERALRRAKSAFQMVRVGDGEELIAYLEGTGRYADRAQYPQAWVVLLDLKMPHRDGFAVLRWRQQTKRWARLPVIVFTSSSLSKDIDRAFAMGANSYVIKPTAAGRLESMVKALHDWWAEFHVGAKPSLA